MKHTVLSVLDKLAKVIENDYALFERATPKIAAPFLSLGSFLDSSGQLEDEQLIDLAELYLCAQGTKKVSLSMSGMKKHNRGFSVRGSGSELYVDRVFGEDRLTPGDRITAMSGKEPAVFRSQSLMASGVLPIGDRDNWEPVLNHTSFVRVQHKDGSEEKLTLRSFTDEPAPVNECRMLPGSDILYLRADCLDGSDECEALLDSFIARAMPCGKIIIDLRQSTGGDSESFGRIAAALPPCGESGPALHDVYYSSENCAVWEQNLSAIAASSPEYAEIIAQLRGELSLLRGSGFAPDEPETAVIPQSSLRGSRKTVILTDFAAADEAESLASLAKGLPGVTLLGRETSGSFCLSHEIRKNLGFCCSLSYPIGAAPSSRENGIRGIAPDIALEWTPAETETDILLEKAKELLK